MPLIDRTGQRFGRLVVTARAANIHRRLTAWSCRCDCGADVMAAACKLVTGHVKSCGCLARDMAAVKNLSHGATVGCQFERRRIPPEYRTWSGMKRRCLVPDDPAYPDYGGRGITIHQPWQSDYAAFLAAVGPRPSPRHTLDRIDNDGNYEPGNVRWATRHQQAQNQRSNRVVTWAGEQLVLREVARRANVRYVPLYKRVVLRGQDVTLAVDRLRAAGSAFVP